MCPGPTAPRASAPSCSATMRASGSPTPAASGPGSRPRPRARCGSSCSRSASRTARFANRLPSLARKGVVWTEPRLVAEVDYRGWTADQQLRHASFKGLREDKEARSVVREANGA
jgi:hypothetical protein